MEDSKKYSKQYKSFLEYVELKYIETYNSEVAIKNMLSHKFDLTVEDINYIIKFIREPLDNKKNILKDIMK